MSEGKSKTGKRAAEIRSAVSTRSRTSRGGRPTKHASEELGRRILDVSAELFASQGFSATSMEQVAAECNAGKDTLYRRYPSKTVLFTAMMEQFRAQVVRDLDETMKEDGAPLEALRRYARLLLSINLRPQLLSLNRVALGEAVTFGGVHPTPAESDPFMARFAALVSSAQRDGRLRKGDPLFIAEQLLYSTSIKPMIAAMLGQERFFDPVEQDRYFDMAWDLFMTGAVSSTTLPASGPSPHE
jgi:TetR/AcrR family transcriptional regulator, regulator of autoinduction and epiphytic fitness